jgi:hypothetical protein
MNTFQTRLASPRFSRLLFWLGVAVLAAGVLALGSRLVGGSDKTPTAAAPDFRRTLPENSVPLKTADGKTIKTYGQLDPAIRSTARTFLATAVRRENLGQSWNVIAPSMKTGYTYAQWKNADALPVIPYPIGDLDQVTYSLDFASTKEILAEVGLSPKPGADIRPARFRIGLVPVGQGAKKRWAVDHWMPLWTPPVPLN